MSNSSAVNQLVVKAKELGSFLSAARFLQAEVKAADDNNLALVFTHFADAGKVEGRDFSKVPTGLVLIENNVAKQEIQVRLALGDGEGVFNEKMSYSTSATTSGRIPVELSEILSNRGWLIHPEDYGLAVTKDENEDEGMDEGIYNVFNSLKDSARTKKDQRVVFVKRGVPENGHKYGQIVGIALLQRGSDRKTAVVKFVHGDTDLTVGSVLDLVNYQGSVPGPAHKALKQAEWIEMSIKEEAFAFLKHEGNHRPRNEKGQPPTQTGVAEWHPTENYPLHSIRYRVHEGSSDGRRMAEILCEMIVVETTTAEGSKETSLQVVDHRLLDDPETNARQSVSTGTIYMIDKAVLRKDFPAFIGVLEKAKYLERSPVRVGQWVKQHNMPGRDMIAFELERGSAVCIVRTEEAIQGGLKRMVAKVYAIHGNPDGYSVGDKWLLVADHLVNAGVSRLIPHFVHVRWLS